MKNLEKLEEFVDEELLPIVEYLAELSILVLEKYKITRNLRTAGISGIWQEFNISFTNKAHIIKSHVPQVI